MDFRTMNTLQKISWWYWGEVAEIVEEEYSDMADIVGVPTLTLMTSSALLLVSIEMFNHGSGFGLIAFVPFSFIGALLLIYTVIAIGASYVYYTQNTESDLRRDMV